MHSQPDARRTGINDPMFAMFWKKNMIPAFKSDFSTIFKQQACFPFQNSNPFVAFLIVPLTFRRNLSIGNDPLDQKNYLWNRLRW